MKIILSRKGIDDKFGNGSSVILPNRKMISFPIPSNNEKNNKYESEKGINYEDISVENGNMKDLYNQLYPNRINNTLICHFDPDLNYSYYPRKENWKGAFGQISRAQTQLENKCVSKGDIFLFFGTYRNSFLTKNGDLKFEPEHSFHAIFGYLQIGQIFDLTVNIPQNIERTYSEHPHVVNKQLKKFSKNKLYVGSKNFMDTNLKGYGTFLFNENLRLTKKGYKKSIWELPSFFNPESGTKIGYHDNRDRYRYVNNKLILQSVAMGQDFVIEGNDQVLKWAENIILNSQH